MILQQGKQSLLQKTAGLFKLVWTSIVILLDHWGCYLIVYPMLSLTRSVSGCFEIPLRIKCRI